MGGAIGSYNLVQSTGTANITGNIYSRGSISLANSNTVSGRISAANTSFMSGPILSVGSNALFNGDIDVNGNIIIGGGTISGKVTHPPGTSYDGPSPTGGNVIGTPNLPTFPALPPINTFPEASGAPVLRVSFARVNALTSRQRYEPGPRLR